MRLVMMSMLIAIMGDTYSRVKSDQARRDLQELLGLVEKYEVFKKVMYRCCRPPPRTTYLFLTREHQ